MAISSDLLQHLHDHSLSFTLLVFLVWVVSRCFYRIFVHPLRHVPGPLIAKCTSGWLAYHGFFGDECSVIRSLHNHYGPVMRISPNDIDIAEGDALWPIYMDKGGFEKPAYYETFDLDGHASIFSARTLLHREPRVKAVLPIFSTSSVRTAAGLISECGDKFVGLLQRGARSGKPVNLLDLTRSFALDAVSSYVFHTDYGALQELKETSADLSAAPCVDAFISDSQFFYLPTSLTRAFQRVWPFDRKTLRSIELVDRYLHSIVAGAGKGTGSYESRLLDRSITRPEIEVQCKDALFAGTDSTGNVLAHICWFLARHPESYAALRKEVLDNESAKVDVLNLPYLGGVVKEALRLTMTISIRLPRVVPEGGWEYKKFRFPAGTKVGVAAFQLHLADDVFPHPEEFRPTRWFDATSQMNRDFLPFGKGARSCIARHLAITELSVVTEKLARSDVLGGAKATANTIEKFEWFFSRIKGDRVELVWPNP